MSKAIGCAPGGVAPYGYQFVDGRLFTRVDEQVTLADMRKCRHAGLPWVKVAQHINATGHRTRTDSLWSRQSAQQVYDAVTHFAA